MLLLHTHELSNDIIYRVKKGEVIPKKGEVIPKKGEVIPKKGEVIPKRMK